MFQFLASITADKIAVPVNVNNYAVRCVQRAGSCKENALVVWQRSCVGRRNAASKITEAFLASLQSFCCAEDHLQSVLFQQERCEYSVLRNVPTIAHHNVSGSTMVSCISPSVGYDLKVWRVLVVLRGNDNDPCIALGAHCAYKYVVKVSWLEDHAQPVDWLPSYLQSQLDAISAQVPLSLSKK